MTPGGHLHAGWDPMVRRDQDPNFIVNPRTKADEVWMSNRYQCLVKYMAPTPTVEWDSAGGEWRGGCPVCDYWVRHEDRAIVQKNANSHMDAHRDRDGLVHLSIHALDRGPMRNWRHLQQIKNEVCGELRTGVELFPPEDQLVDSANEYHLWVFPDGFTPGFGLGHEPLVSDDEMVKEFNDAPHRGRQEPWEPGLTTGRTEHSRPARERLREEMGEML